MTVAIQAMIPSQNADITILLRPIGHKHCLLILILANYIVRAVPSGIHDGEENGSFVHLRASVEHVSRPVHVTDIPLPYGHSSRSRLTPV